MEEEMNKSVRRFKASEFKENAAGANLNKDKLNNYTPFGTVEPKKNVFKPQGEDLQEEQTSFSPFSGNTKKCPGCGSNLYYDAGEQSLICHSCGNIYDPSTMEMNGSLGIENPEQEYDANDTLDYDDDKKVEIVCNSCGSQIITDSNTAATICPFCGSPTLIARKLTRQFRPDAIIPFSITKEDAQDLYLKHLAGVPHVPKQFKSEATVKKITGIYVPFWLISADVNMDIGGWTHKVIDGSSFYDPVKQEETHTHSIDIPIDGNISFSLKNVPFDASKKISDRLMEACEPFDLSALVPYNASYLPGFIAEKYDAQPKDMYERIKKRLDNYCHNVAEMVQFEDADAFTYNSMYSGISYKNYKVIYCLLPIWFLQVDYNDMNFQFAVNGQTGEVCGTIPESKLWMKLTEFADNTMSRITMVTPRVRALLYALPVTCFAFFVGFFFSFSGGPLNSLALTFLGIIFFIGIISTIAFLILPPILLNAEKKQKNKLFNEKNLHKLDRAPDVSYYYDSTKKLVVNKHMTKGGEFGMTKPHLFGTRSTW